MHPETLMSESRPKRGRPPTVEGAVEVAVTLPARLVARLNVWAIIQGMDLKKVGLSPIIRKALEEWWEGHQKRAAIEAILAMKGQMASQDQSDDEEDAPPLSPVSSLIAEGRKELEAKKYVPALGFFQRAASAEPANAEAVYWCGVALTQMTLKGDGRDRADDREREALRRRAVAAFERVLQMDPTHSEAQRALRLVSQPTTPTKKGKR